MDEPKITQENDACDLRIETVKPLENGNESFYLKCEPTFVAKDNATMVIVGRWILYPCENRTIDECIVAEKSSISKSIQSVLNLTFSDAPVSGVGFGPMPNTLLLNSDNTCVSNPPSPGAQCCLSHSASESDLSNARYFFQCHPAEQGNFHDHWEEWSG
uniref:Uncharacterized protein n=1 Tax=Romanomermis culicivorax TaxID=13658 RepID=A0A915HQY8_ROMCU